MSAIPDGARTVATTTFHRCRNSDEVRLIFCCFSLGRTFMRLVPLRQAWKLELFHGYLGRVPDPRYTPGGCLYRTHNRTSNTQESRDMKIPGCKIIKTEDRDTYRVEEMLRSLADPLPRGWWSNYSVIN